MKDFSLKNFFVTVGLVTSFLIAPAFVTTAYAEDDTATASVEKKATKIKFVGFKRSSAPVESSNPGVRSWTPPDYSETASRLIRNSKSAFYKATNFADYIPEYRNSVYNYFYTIEGADSLKAIQDLSSFVQKIDAYLAELPKEEALDYASAFTHIHSAVINQVENDLQKRPDLTASKDATQMYYYNSIKSIKDSVEDFVRTAYKGKNYSESFYNNFVTDYTAFNGLLQVLMLRENFCQTSECYSYYMKATSSLSQLPVLTSYQRLLDSNTDVAEREFRTNRDMFARYLNFLPLEAFQDNYPRVH